MQQRRITLLRHAKSDWNSPTRDDFDRPLNARGNRDAPRMGKQLYQRGLHPQLILSSPALRAITTAEIVAAELGYKTERTANGAVGFFHGTGHGLGLAIHEAPRLGSVHRKLRKGTVVTVEPGLYYPGLGGCRIEDVVQVTDAKPKMLSKFHYDWVL